MGDEQGGAALAQYVDGLQYCTLSNGVQIDGWFVEDEYGCILEEGAGDCNALNVYCCSGRAPVRRPGIVIVEKKRHTVVQLVPFGSFDHLFLHGV